MIMQQQPHTIRVLCVDDNFLVAEGIRTKLGLSKGFEWVGQLPDATNLISHVRRTRPDIVLIDLDMPGKDAFEAMRELHDAEPTIRAIVISGHVRSDLVDRAVESGAWGYLSKGEGTDTIVDAIKQVMTGKFAIGPDTVASAHST